ncbi:MAG: hypothetical protein BJ554DRAFT_134 [Olpidium bornovanus]|uniref:TLDc domain-containing protein n=1 Tax=Olpidium bornovanus TaxID=278681 RepID=A0A8H7ZTZ4_9FUNG|nr:MAG: hypothetical protein BJ554DRAFT_134 [Olpidium bornovanus]
MPKRKLPRPDVEQILQDKDWLPIWKSVPSRHRLLDLRLAFTTAEHGRSIGTLFELTKGWQPMLLIVETTNLAKFGGTYSYSAFVRMLLLSLNERRYSSSCPLSVYQRGLAKDRNRFGGSGETFLFDFTTDGAYRVYPWVGAHPANGSPAHESNGDPPHGSNASMREKWIKDMASFFVVADHHGIGVGGGGSGFGLWVNGDLTVAHSHECATFANRPLGGPGTYGNNLDVALLEVWVFT